MPPPSPSAAQSAQASQAGLAAIVASAMADLFKRLDVNNLKASLPAFTAATKLLVDKHGAASGTLASRFYRQQRSAAGLRGTFTPRIASPPPLGKVKAGIAWGTRTLWTPEPDLESAATTMQGVAETMVLDVGRQTVIDSVHADRQAKGWARVPEPGACSFCILLSTRGAVYKADTVGFAAHPSCRCHAEPVFNAYEPTAEIRGWQQLYKESTAGKSGAAARLAFRQAVEGRRS